MTIEEYNKYLATGAVLHLYAILMNRWIVELKSAYASGHGKIDDPSTLDSFWCTDCFFTLEEAENALLSKYDEEIEFLKQSIEATKYRRATDMEKFNKRRAGNE